MWRAIAAAPVATTAVTATTTRTGSPASPVMTAAALMTAYYTFRLYFRVFQGPEIIPPAPAADHGHGAADPHAPAHDAGHDKPKVDYAAHDVPGGHPEPGGEHAVIRRGGPAALDVAQHRAPGFLAGPLLDLVGQHHADAAQPHVAERVQTRPAEESWADRSCCRGSRGHR